MLFSFLSSKLSVDYWFPGTTQKLNMIRQKFPPDGPNGSMAEISYCILATYLLSLVGILGFQDSPKRLKILES